MTGVVFCILVLISATVLPAAENPPNPKVQSLLSCMTLEEKLALVHGVRDPEERGQAGYWPGLPRLGIPPLRLADGAGGINVNHPTTSLPAPVALAATFSVQAARLYGVLMGREAKALGEDVLLAPHVNIVRDPLFRRNHTSLSEDQYLNAQLASSEIAGIQSEGIMAQVKHLAGYNGSDSVWIDERTLHEIYLPAFQAAVEAGAASVMCAYNRINGPWACENADLLSGILRGAWGFAGFVTSDWGAVHSPQAITEGLDLEMPGREIAGRPGGPQFTDALKAAVETGAIPVSAIDQALARILVQMDRFHLLDVKPPARPRTINVEAHAKLARRIATEGAVLLKNDAGALPLTAEDLASLALIGPTAGQLAAGFLGERAYGFEDRLVSPLDAFRRLSPRAMIAYSAGVDLTGVVIPGSALSHDGRPGLLRQPGAGESGPAQVDQAVDFQGPTGLASDADYSWTGALTGPEAGDYTLMVQPALTGGSDGGGTVAIDGRLVARTGGPGFGGSGMVTKKWSSLLPTTDERDNGIGTIRLTAGPHQIALTANSIGQGPLSIRFSWITPQFRRARIDAAVAVARAVRTAVVFAWSGMGGSFSLPEDQDDLIEKVAAANPRTVVILNTGGPVAMPWRDKVRAILEMWYPGQEGGWATADLALGRANPGGRLPVTFPAKLEDTPARAAGHPERLGPPRQPPAPGGPIPVAPPVTYSEGIAVGYRWYDQQQIEPLFPFGHGLSYTHFEYSGLAVWQVANGFDVTFTVRNTGPRAGTEVPQAYVGPVENPPVPMAPRSLVGFRRITLASGRSASVTVHVDPRQLCYWSADTHGWTTARGSRKIFVGASSRDIRLQGTLAR
ncbi:MAG: glycoside hydrolase family 3 C-terminal domain-containing protein [Terriglobia bacterium]